MKLHDLCEKLRLANNLLLPQNLVVEIIADSFEFDRKVKRASADEAASNALSGLLFEAGERHDEFEGIDLDAVHAALAGYYREQSTSQMSDSVAVFE